MTRTSSARIAGATFLLYIVFGMVAAGLFGRAVGGDGTTVITRVVARHVGALRVSMVCSLLCSFAAVTLAVTLHALTRDVDRDLALMILVLRMGEGVMGAVSLSNVLGLLELAGGGPGVSTLDAGSADQFAAFLVLSESPVGAGAVFFALASAIFSCLLLRGRIGPAPLAWVGVVASIVLMVALPLRLAGLLDGPLFPLVWLPMLAFEVPLAVWLLTRAGRQPRAREVA